MKSRRVNLLYTIALLQLVGICLAQTSSPYIEQSPPGMTPEVFAPGMICLPDRCEVGGFFSPDMNEFYFTETDGRWTWTRILEATRQDGQWSTPIYTPSFRPNDALPRFVPDDGQRMYFFRNSPATQSDVWVTERLSSGWGPAERLPEPVNSNTAEWGYSQAADGTIYISSRRGGNADLYCIQTTDGQYGPAEPVSVCNTPHEENGPYVSPDHTFLLFHSNRPGGFGKADLYVSLRQDDGAWSSPVNMGPTINTSIEQWDPKITPDGKYLFYIHRSGWSSDNDTSDIYWVDARAALPEANGAIRNLTTSQRFGSIQCAVNYAQDGDTIVLEPGTYHEAVDLNGKDLTLQSVDPTNPSVTEVTIVRAAPESPVVRFTNNTKACQIRGLTIAGGLHGLHLSKASPRIEHCRITNNAGPGIAMQAGSEPTIRHTLICDNQGAGIVMTPRTGGRWTVYNEPVLANCTIARNGGEAISGGVVTVRNCILWGNGTEFPMAQLTPVDATVSYSCIQDGANLGTTWAQTNEGNIKADPMFLAPGSYRLHPDSPCIDAGDPAETTGEEPLPNGARINMGAYGGTVQATRTVTSPGN